MNTEKKQITVVDFLSKGNSHFNFNVSFLTALNIAGFKVNHIGLKSQSDLISLPWLEKRSVKTKESNWRKRVFSVFKATLKKQPKNLVIVCFDNFLTTSLFLLFFPFFLKSNITIVIHNNLTGLLRGGIKSLPIKFFIKTFNPKIICLSKEAFIQVNNLRITKKTTYIPHMNTNHLYGYSTEPKLDISKINIAVFGRHSEEFLKKIVHNLDLDKLKEIKFNVYTSNQDSLNFHNLNIHSKWVSNEEMKSILRYSDYCFFGFKNDTLRASGVLLDAISARCPIISKNEPPFNEFNLGKSIIHYSNIEDLNQLLLDIDVNERTRSDFDEKDYHEVLQETSIQRFSKKLKKLFTD